MVDVSLAGHWELILPEWLDGILDDRLNGWLDDWLDLVLQMLLDWDLLLILLGRLRLR